MPSGPTGSVGALGQIASGWKSSSARSRLPFAQTSSISLRMISLHSSRVPGAPVGITGGGSGGGGPGGAGATPSWTSIPAMSALNQPCVTLLSFSRKRRVPVHEIFLFVGGMPKNSPSFVPLISPRPKTRSPSANRSTNTKTASENGPAKIL